MSDEATKGKRIISIIVAGLLVPNLALLLVPGSSLRVIAGRSAIAVIMSFLMWRGYSWARSYMSFSLGLAALLAVLSGLLGLLTASWGAVLLLVAPLYAWGAWALWSSPAVEAYIAHREQERNPDMSFNTGH